MDFDQWVAYRPNDVEGKNPTKLNKALSKKLSTLKKQEGDPNQISKIGELLNIYDLKAQTQSVTTPLYIIYSRSPIDVARMSDHKGMSSCHSEGGDYFACAVSDAMNNAGIAYLVTEETFELIPDLQADEIFEDNDRGTGEHGVAPLARIRLRKLLDKNGKQQVVPSLKLYGKGSYQNVFTDSVEQWAKSNINPEFKWDGVLILRGGSYEDLGADVVKMAKKIFGKTINVVKEYGEREWGDEFSYGDGLDEEDERIWDEFKNEVEWNLESLKTSFVTYEYYDFQDNEVLITISFEKYMGDLSDLIDYDNSVIVTAGDFERSGLEHLEPLGVKKIRLFDDRIEFYINLTDMLEPRDYYTENNGVDEFLTSLKVNVGNVIDYYTQDDEIYLDQLIKNIYIPNLKHKTDKPINEENIERVLKIMYEYGHYDYGTHENNSITFTVDYSEVNIMVESLVKSKIEEISNPDIKESVKNRFTVGRVYYDPDNPFRVKEYIFPEPLKDLYQNFVENKSNELKRIFAGKFIEFYEEIVDLTSPKEKSMLADVITAYTKVDLVKYFSTFSFKVNTSLKGVFDIRTDFTEEDVEAFRLFAEFSSSSGYAKWGEETIGSPFKAYFKKYVNTYLDTFIRGNDPNQGKFDFFDDVGRVKLEEALSYILMTID